MNTLGAGASRWLSISGSVYPVGRAESTRRMRRLLGCQLARGEVFGDVTAEAVPPPQAGDAALEEGAPLFAVIGGLMLVMLMAALDATIVSTALPTIVGDLGGLQHISWVVTAYLLAQTAVMPLYG